MSELDLDEIRSSAEAGFVFRPTTVLALLTRLEQAEQQAKTVRELFETYEHRDKLEAYYRAIDGDDSLWQSLTGKPLDGDTRGR